MQESTLAHEAQYSEERGETLKSLWTKLCSFPNSSIKTISAIPLCISAFHILSAKAFDLLQRWLSVVPSELTSAHKVTSLPKMRSINFLWKYKWSSKSQKVNCRKHFHIPYRCTNNHMAKEWQSWRSFGSNYFGWTRFHLLDIRNWFANVSMACFPIRNKKPHLLLTYSFEK